MSEQQHADDDWPGILICTQCRQYVDADMNAEQTACEHSWNDARDISDLDDETWAKIRHDSYVRELEKDNPRGSRDMLTSELTSLMFDLVMADVLPDDYDDRDGLDKLLVTEADT